MVSSHEIYASDTERGGAGKLARFATAVFGEKFSFHLTDRLNVAAACVGAVPYFYSTVYESGERKIWVEAMPVDNLGRHYQLNLCEANHPRNQVLADVPVKTRLVDDKGSSLLPRADAILQMLLAQTEISGNGWVPAREQPYAARHVNVVTGQKTSQPGPVI